MPENKEEKPKIIIDDDWKTQAQAEKEKLSEEVEKGGPAGGPQELPQASMASLVSQIVAQIFYSLGGVEDPRTKKRYVDLTLAKHLIDTLALLEVKTKGNLTEDEKKVLDQALYETRMHYVEIAQRV